MVVRNQHLLSSLPTPHGHLDLTHPRRQHSLPENHEHQIELLKFPQYRLEARPHSPIPRMGTTAGPQPGRGRESPSCRRYGSGILYLGRQPPSLRDVTTPPLKCPMDYGDKKDNNNNPSAARERLEFREPPATRAEPRNACVDQGEDEDTTATCAKTMARYKQWSCSDPPRNLVHLSRERRISESMLNAVFTFFLSDFGYQNQTGFFLRPIGPRPPLLFISSSLILFFTHSFLSYETLSSLVPTVSSSPQR